ncbi:nuclear transport factor 2 family protein [Sphingobium estronivorans]|uniref:nuclear transport factor 2 family protein n=1 Tax=Sphingobium estronivorans TaxID=1577690 RepID=UPI00123A3C25|nr:nuclear transport factor 2 family protein [Sphingobium estronivorans]
MAYSLQELSDFEDIRTLKHRYFRGIDTADLPLLATLFTDDISVEYRGGGYKVKLAGRDNMMDFLANSFHSGTAPMHHGHMPEITLTGADEAEGIWYLEDIFINLDDQLHTSGSAIYRDKYRREDGVWRIARTEYDRLVEVVQPLDSKLQITAHWLANTGRKPHERTDIGHFIQWGNG